MFPNHPPRRWASFSAALALTFGGFAACAHAEPFNPDGLNASEARSVADICASVMHLPSGEAHYQGCLESLSQSLAGLGQSQAVQDAHEACLKRGLQPSSPDLATCTLTLADSGQPHETLAVGASAAPAIPGGARSFFWASNHDRRGRERLACALLGLDPARDGFQGCVADLQATMFALDNPPN